MPEPRESLTTADVRAHNLGLVLSHLDRVGSASRTEIADATGLVRGAITALAAELIDAGLVRSASAATAAAPARAGRPQEKLELDGSTLGILAVQFWIDEVSLQLSDVAGRPLLSEEGPVHIPFGDPEALADILAERIRSVASRTTVRIVQTVLVVPAPVFTATQVIPIAVDFGWNDVDLPGLLAERIPPPPLGIRTVNDANAATYAEFDALRSDPALAPVTDIVYVKSDTGIGGGAVVAGAILVGSNGFAFEPGHVVVAPDGPRCECGRRGCLVTVAGPEVVLGRAGLAGFAEEEGMPAALEELLRRRRAGDPVVAAAVVDAARWIRLVLANLVMLFQPQYIVLGGYLAGLTEELAELPYPAPRSPDADDDGAGPATVRPAAHGRHSALDGALMIARHDLLAAPGALRLAGFF